jgi:hypothetical protein
MLQERLPEIRVNWIGSLRVERPARFPPVPPKGRPTTTAGAVPGELPIAVQGGSVWRKLTFKSNLMLRLFSGNGPQSIMNASATRGPTSLLRARLTSIRKFISKPASTHHLYEIHTAPQGELITAVSPEQIVELVRLRDFH